MKFVGLSNSLALFSNCSIYLAFSTKILVFHLSKCYSKKEKAFRFLMMAKAYSSGVTMLDFLW